MWMAVERIAKGPAIISIEDDPGVASILADIFIGEGVSSGAIVSLTGLSDIKDFIGKVKAGEGLAPAVMLLNYGIPGVNTLEFLDCLRSEKSPYKATPIFVTSAADSLGLDQLCRQHGATDFFKKPFDLESFIPKVIQHILNHE